MVLLKEAKGHSDVGLVAECQNGDSTAFDELVRRYKDRIYNVVYRFLGNHEDALDVSQEVFVRAYRGIREFQGHAQVYTWLYSIARNLARNQLEYVRSQAYQDPQDPPAACAIDPGLAVPSGFTLTCEVGEYLATETDIASIVVTASFDDGKSISLETVRAR